MEPQSSSRPTSQDEQLYEEVTFAGCIRRKWAVDTTIFQLQESSECYPSVIRQKSDMWHDALMIKKDAAERMLWAQKIIQEVEDEVAEHLTRDTIAHLHARFYGVEDESTPEGQFLSSISDVLVVSAMTA
ncbi:hypothetical protein JVT61DRAFT_9549 [Boletus reticuloceps]|uniref:Uncharacterized protein n=1 Tax=Boletus reticuloceps TaxID=495285 RepID=A0A8I2YG60_9AGAM|nr:hypothetical protein JVT61DRAFT_9549 [Boletus reticuloceps]